MTERRTKSDRDVALSTIEENGRLRLALDRYGRHDDSCSEWPEQSQPCDCGFTAAMSALPERKRVVPLPSRSCRHGINPDECEFCDSPGADKEEATRRAIAANDRAALASPEPTPAPEHDINCGIDALRLGEDIGCTCHVRFEDRPTPATGLSAEALRAEIRGMLADLLVTLDAPNPRLALQTGIEAIDYRLAHFEYIAARTPTDSPEESA